MKKLITESGISAFLKPYEEMTLRMIHLEGRFITGSDLTLEINEELEKNGLNPTSRSTITNFLNFLLDADLIEAKPTTGKGGQFYLYAPKHHTVYDCYTEIFNRIIRNMIKAFPKLHWNTILTDAVKAEIEIIKKQRKPFQ